MIADSPVVTPLASVTANGHTTLVAGSALTLDRILLGDGTSTFVSADGYTTMKIAHTASGRGVNKRGRHLIRFDVYGGIEGPPAPGSTTPSTIRGDVVASAYLVVDCPSGWEKTQPVGQLLMLLGGLLVDPDAMGYITPIDTGNDPVALNSVLMEFLGGEF